MPVSPVVGPARQHVARVKGAVGNVDDCRKVERVRQLGADAQRVDGRCRAVVANDDVEGVRRYIVDARYAESPSMPAATGAAMPG